MTLYLQGVLLGMALQLSVGPVFFALLHKSIREGFAEALKMVFGVALVDAAYIALSFTAVSGILSANANLAGALRIFGAAVLIYFGIGYFKRAGKGKTENGESANGGSFVYGLKLTMINPLSIVFWTGTFGAVVASGIVAGGMEIFAYAGGCVSATLLFLTGAAFFGSRLQGAFSPGIMRNLDRFVGSVLFLFAFFLLLK